MRRKGFEPDTAPGAVFFAAYAGPSMNPTLREPEIMEIRPYDGRLARVGDVVFFQPPAGGRAGVHRIVRLTPAGIATRGDNNTREDDVLLQPGHIKGRVVAAWRGQKRRMIGGGWPGRLASCWLRWGCIVDRRLSPLLHPPYQALARCGLIARVVPPPLRPRVVVFFARGREQVHLLLGRRVIGRYDDQRGLWQIRRPFRLFVAERVLLRRQRQNGTGSCRSIEAREP